MVQFNHSTSLMIILSNVEGQLMLHRIFLAINLPESVKNELTSFKEWWPELPARWTKPENLHITLVFYGSASEKELEEIKHKTKGVVQKYKPFTLTLTRIVYGPSKKEARMVWAIGESPKEFLALQQGLVTVFHRLENRKFSLHLTLARMKEWELHRMEAEERPEINTEINVNIPVNSIEIMESKLKRTDAEYTILDNIKLNDR